MSLQDLGLSDVGMRLYTVLLASPEIDRTELASRAGLDSETLASELTSLLDLGVLRADDAVESGVSAPHPALTVNTLIERLEDELITRYRRVSVLRSQVGSLEAQFRAGRGESHQSDPGIERVEGLEQIRERIDELTFFTRTSVLSIQPGGPQSPEALEASRPLDLRMSRRKVQIRLIHESSVLDDELNRVHLRELLMLNAQIRLVEQPVERMLIFDTSVAVVPIEPGNSRRGALLVREPGLVAGLIDLFERTWSTATELPWIAGHGKDSPDTVTADDRTILAMLASGCTDETVARQLEMSVRHLRRTISRLMADLGAKSRFEAGAQAQRKGWLD